MHELDDTLRRFHPQCFVEFDEENPGGETRWSGGPPYEDIVLLGDEDFRELVAEKVNEFNLERLLELEEANRGRDDVVEWLEERLEERNERLNDVEQLE